MPPPRRRLQHASHTVRRVTNGIIRNVAGRPNWGGYGGDGGPATLAWLNGIHHVGVDNAPRNGFYIAGARGWAVSCLHSAVPCAFFLGGFADCYNHRVRYVDGSGVISTIVSSVAYPKSSDVDEDGGV